MVKEIRIYIEGGGNSKANTSTFRHCWNTFLSDIVEAARRKRIRWAISLCGGRENTFDDFCKALKSYRDVFNILLVDAEGPVTATPWEHLQQQDGWCKPRGVEDDQCHLMVQMMEAWLIADRAALGKFYGPHFNPSALPSNLNVEQIDKEILERALKKATDRTSKETYHKSHGLILLEYVSLEVVCQAAPHCERLVSTLRNKIDE